MSRRSKLTGGGSRPNTQNEELAADGLASRRRDAPPLAQGPRIELIHRMSHFLLSHPFKGAGFLATQIPKFLVPAASGPVRVRTAEGLDLIVDPKTDSGVQRTLYMCGTYEPGTLKVIRSCLRQSDTFIDVGCNIGVISTFASRLVGPGGAIISFEPEPELYRRLLENLALNGSDNVHPFPLAMGSASGRAKLYPCSPNKGHTSLVRPNSVEPEAEEVEVGTLDEFIALHNVPGVRMVKIDVEGWELEVLKGARRLFSGRDAPILSIECSRLHPLEGGSVGDLLELITTLNDFLVFKDKRGMPPLTPVRIEAALPRHGNLFCFLPGHLQSVPNRLFR